MDTNLILCWIVGVNCLAGSVRLLRLGHAQRASTRGWLVLYASLLGALLVGLLVVPDRVGLWVGSVWSVTVLIPVLGSAILTRLLQRHWFASAALVARGLAVLHPLDGWRQFPDFVHMSRCLHTGAFDEARERIVQVQAVPGQFAGSARVMSVSLTGDWTSYCEWIETHANRSALLRDVSVFNGYLSALGRTGHPARMLAVYRDLAEPLLRRWGGVARAMVRITVLTQCGSVGPLEKVLDGAGHTLPRATRLNYLARAEQIAGQSMSANRHLRLILDDKDAAAITKLLSQRMLDDPAPVLNRDELDEEALSTLEGLEREIRDDQQFGVPTASTSRRPVLTWSIAAVMVTVFLVELLNGDPTDPENLIALGALVISADSAWEQWWRPFTAGFLHFGYWHLGMNLAALLLLGSWLERAWRGRLVLSCYLLSIAAAGLLLPILDGPTVERPVMVVVGASGGIMGLLGALLGRLLLGRFLARSPVVRGQLVLLCMVVLLQVAFDLSVPQVSSTAHLTGLLTGLSFGLIVTACRNGRALVQERKKES